MRGFSGVSNPFSGVEVTAEVMVVPVKILFPFPRPALLRMARCTITLSPASTVFGSAHITLLAINQFTACKNKINRKKTVVTKINTTKKNEIIK